MSKEDVKVTVRDLPSHRRIEQVQDYTPLTVKCVRMDVRRVEMGERKEVQIELTMTETKKIQRRMDTSLILTFEQAQALADALLNIYPSKLARAYARGSLSFNQP